VVTFTHGDHLLLLLLSYTTVAHSTAEMNPVRISSVVSEAAVLHLLLKPLRAVGRCAVSLADWVDFGRPFMEFYLRPNIRLGESGDHSTNNSPLREMRLYVGAVRAKPSIQQSPKLFPGCSGIFLPPVLRTALYN
jgi:hypothetical protein